MESCSHCRYVSTITTMNIKEQFGRRLKDLREHRGMTQETLADLSGLHPTYISGIERGRRNVSLENIGRLAAAFGISPSDLVGELKEQ